MSGEPRDRAIDSSRKTASKGDDGNTATGRPARSKSASRGRPGTGTSGSAKAATPAPSIDVVLERRGRGYAVMIEDRMKQAGDDGDSFYRAVLLALGQTRGDEVASYDIQALRNDVADTLMPRLNSGLLRNWWQNRKRRTGLTPERYIERYIRSPGSWDEPLAQLLPVIVPSCATWRRLGGKRLTVDAPGHGRHADQHRQPAVLAIRASDLWNDFIKGDATVFAPMPPQVLRDRPLSISLLTRAAHMTLDHPRDAVDMRAVPGELTVMFPELAEPDAAADQRNLVLLPSSTALVDSHGSLPTIEVLLAADESAKTSTYTVTDTGSGATVRFVFAAGVACPAIEVLSTLKTAADVKQAFLATASNHLMAGFNDLLAPSEQGPRPPAQRAVMARLWSDLSDEVRRRVLAGFAGRDGLAAVDLDVVRELKSGTDAPRVALANDMLVAALDLWQVRGDISRIPFSFWRTEMAREMPSDPDGPDFIRARGRVQASFMRWQAVHADFRRWLDDPAVGGSAQLDATTRDCIRAALARADEAGTAGPPPLRELAAHELRSRLLDLHQQIAPQRDASAASAPGDAAAAMSRWAAQLCGGIAEREQADDAGAVAAPTVPPVSVLWPRLAADATRNVLHLDSRAERDQAIDLSLMRRRATLVLDHPGDMLQMTGIPAGLQVRFDAAGPGSVGSDQRWLIVLPGQSDFLGRFGPLPTVYVTLSRGEQPGWQDYVIFDSDVRKGCTFTFTGAVAPRARSVLASLKQAADAKWTAFRDLYGELSNNVQLGTWDAEHRAAAAACWHAFPPVIRQRVLYYYRLDVGYGTLLDDLDIGDVLTRGKGAADVALARQVLMGAMDYWDEHGELDDVAESFWEDAVRRGASRPLSPANFAAIVEAALQAHREWQETAPLFNDMLQWLAQPMLQSDIRYRQWRQCLLRATQRAVGLDVAASSEYPDSLAQATPAQVRARLALARQAVVMPDPPSMKPSRVMLRLRTWMSRIGGAEPTVLDADSDALDEATIAQDCKPAGMGVRVVTYLLDANLPASRVAGLFSIDSALLADGTVPLEMLDGSGDDGPGGRWWRSFRFYGAWKYDAAQRSWHCPQHDMIVAGSLAGQREALDAHMRSLQEDAAASQALFFLSNDRPQVELSDGGSYILAPQSGFAQRSIELVGEGALLLLPEDLQGTVTIDLSRLDPDAPAQVMVASGLWATLQSHDPVQRDGKTFLRYRHVDDDSLMLQIGPQESGHPLGLTLKSKLREFALTQLTDDLADETKRVVLVSAELDDDIVLPPMTRNVLVYPLGRSPSFVIQKLGPARLQLLSGPRIGESSADLRIRCELPPEVLPRYGVSDLTLGHTGYLSAAIRDNQDGGIFLFCCAPRVTFDRSTWISSVSEITQVHDQYIDYMLDWDERLRHDASFEPSDLQVVERYGAALDSRIDQQALMRAAYLSEKVELRQQDELDRQQPGRKREPADRGRLRAGTVLAQMLLFSFSDVFDGLTIEQWRSLVDGRDSPSMAGRLFGMYVDTAWQRKQADEFYSGLAGLYSFLRMSTTDEAEETALERDENCIDAVLDLIAGNPVSDESLQQAGLADVKGHPEHLTRLKLIMVTRLDERLFDDDPFWRNRLLNDLRRAHVRTRRNNVFNLLASIVTGRGGRDAVMMAYEHRKLSPKENHPALPETDKRPDVIVFDQLSTIRIEQRAKKGGKHRLSRRSEKPNDDNICRFVAALNFTGALLVFIGDVGTALSKWYIADDGSPRQRHTTMYFQIVKSFGWGAQQAAGFACQPEQTGPMRFIERTAPVMGIGMAFNYLAGGLAELIVRPPRTNWTWRRDMRPLIARVPRMGANKIMQMVDMAGNIYLLIAEASRIVGISERAQTLQGSDVISATVSCASAGLGMVTAVGEFGAKSLLTPAKSFYQAVGMSSSLLNLCASSTDVLPSTTLRADDVRPEL